MRTVLFLTAARFLGGAERSLVELLAALRDDPAARDAWRPLVALPEAASPELQAALAAVAETRALPLPELRRTRSPLRLAALGLQLLRARGRLARLCRAEPVALVHANHDLAALVAAPETARAGAPLVWHSRDLLDLGRPARTTAARAAAVVAISRAVAAHLAARGVPPKKIRVIPNGIELARCAEAYRRRAELRGEVRAELGLPPAAPLLVDVGALIPWKNHEAFLELVAGLRRAFPGACGLVAGAPPSAREAAYAEELAARARRSGGAVRLVGRRADVPRLLAAADLAVSTSRAEPFGRVLVEALAVGTPVLATDSGGKREILRDGATGRLVPPEAPGALAAAAAELLADPSRRRRLGAAGRRDALVRFDVRRVAGALRELWRTLPGRAPPA